MSTNPEPERTLKVVPGNRDAIVLTADIHHLPIMVPQDAEFEGNEFLDAPALDNLCKDLRERHAVLFDFAQVGLLCLWKREGGKSKGKERMAGIQAATGLLRHFAESAFVIWLAADHLQSHCKEAGILPRRIVEAVLCHEMLHLSYDPESGKYGLRGHDVEAFEAEIELYGLWRSDLQRMAKKCKQLELFENMSKGAVENDAARM